MMRMGAAAVAQGSRCDGKGTGLTRFLLLGLGILLVLAYHRDLGACWNPSTLRPQTCYLLVRGPPSVC
jgi:hypothetical protein